MKKIFLMLTVIVFTFLLFACNQPQQPTDAKITQAYKDATEAYGWFDLSTLRSDSSDSKDINGSLYYRVTNERFKTYADLKTYLETLFDSSIVEQLFSREIYVDIDGVLYSIDAARGADITKGEEKITITREDENKIIVQVDVDVIGDIETGQVTGTEMHKYPYELVNGKWIFTDFYLFK